MLETTQHSSKQNIYHLAEKGQIIIFSMNFLVSLAGAQMINVNFFFFLSCSFNIKSELTIYV